MKSKLLGKVTEGEKKQILKLHERLATLRELKECKDNLDIDEIARKMLLKKIYESEVKTKKEIERWWQEELQRYEFKKNKDIHCSIDVNANEVFLNME